MEGGGDNIHRAPSVTPFRGRIFTTGKDLLWLQKKSIVRVMGNYCNNRDWPLLESRLVIKTREFGNFLINYGP